VFAAPASAVPATAGAAAAIPHIAASNTAAFPSAAATPDATVAASIAAAAAIHASEFQETPLKGRRGTDHKALRSSSKVFFIMYHVAKHLTSFLGHGAKC